MPEMPEVSVMVDRLQKYVGWNVEEIQGDPVRSTKERYASASFTGRDVKIKGIFRRGKFIIFMLDDFALLCHNAMSGFWDAQSEPWTFDYVEGQRKSKMSDVRAHVKLRRSQQNEAAEYETLLFHDARKFGYLKILSPEQLAKKISELGPEADHTDNLYEPTQVITEHDFSEMCRTKRLIKDVLMDQKCLAGVGNIYASEALWTASISPSRPADTLPVVGHSSRLSLFLGVRSVLRQALERRLDYSGLRVYRRKNCERCSGKILNTKIKGRSTYWCPECQT